MTLAYCSRTAAITMPHAEVTAPPITRLWVADRLKRDWSLLPAGDSLPLFRLPPERTPVPAAVLVPLVNRQAGVHVLLTQRTAHLNDHAGQISFPGGRVDAGDADRIDTALREAEEETGLPRAKVDVLGFLPDYDIMTGFRVTPVVGWVEPPFPIAPDPFEVADIFEVPLEFLLDPANHRRHSRTVDDCTRHYYSMPWENRNIWGATAGMLHTLYRLLSHEG
jgi:8-oxo-dGTP pyrophosphatase MutT (NUDIX family)